MERVKFITSLKKKTAEVNLIYFSSLMMVMLILFAIIMNTLTYYVLIKKMKNVMRECSIYVMTENWDNMFYSLRDGYSGAYSTTGASEEDLAEVYENMSEALGTVENAGVYEKRSEVSEEVVYTYHDLHIDIENTGFTNDENRLDVVISLVLELPVFFLDFYDKKITLNLREKATWVEKF